MDFNIGFWIGFLLFVVIALAIDLGVINRKPHTPSFKEALIMSTAWFVLANIFCIMIYFYAGHQPAYEFLAGYLVELSLSMDNVFVFVLIFSYFKVPPQYQHRVLFWGIIGAIIMRLIMITSGIYLVNQFQSIFYVFGLFLIYSAYKIAFAQDTEMNLEDNKLLRFLKKYANLTDKYHEEKFFVTENGKMVFTPLFLVLILIENTDLIFAMDSIPAILAITQNPFIVFTSNIFAILGLRSLYFLLARVVDKFVYLKYGLAVILGYIGIKMILVVQGYHIPTMLSLGVIIACISISIIASFIKLQYTKHKRQL